MLTKISVTSREKCYTFVFSLCEKQINIDGVVLAS